VGYNLLFGSTTASVLHRIYIKYIGQHRFLWTVKTCTLGKMEPQAVWFYTVMSNNSSGKVSCKHWIKLIHWKSMFYQRQIAWHYLLIWRKLQNMLVPLGCSC